MRRLANPAQRAALDSPPSERFRASCASLRRPAMIKERPERGPRPSVERVERGGLPSDGDSLLETPERPEHVEAVVALHIRALGVERQSPLEVGAGALPFPLCRATD